MKSYRITATTTTTTIVGIHTAIIIIMNQNSHFYTIYVLTKRMRIKTHKRTHTHTEAQAYIHTCTLVNWLACCCCCVVRRCICELTFKIKPAVWNEYMHTHSLTSATQTTTNASIHQFPWEWFWREHDDVERVDDKPTKRSRALQAVQKIHTKIRARAETQNCCCYGWLSLLLFLSQWIQQRFTWLYVCMEWRWAREGKERKCEEQERMNWREKKMQNKHGRIDMQLVAGGECVTKIKYYFSLWILCVAAMVLRDIFSTVVDEKRIFIGGTQTHSHPHEWMAAYKHKLTQQPKTSIYLRNTLSQRAHFHTVHIDCVCLYVNLYVFRS